MQRLKHIKHRIVGSKLFGYLESRGEKLLVGARIICIIALTIHGLKNHTDPTMQQAVVISNKDMLNNAYGMNVGMDSYSQSKFLEQTSQKPK